MPVTHPFESKVPDSTDATLVRPSNWNAEHVVDVDLETEVFGVGPIENGFTNASSQVTNGINYFDGTKITSSNAFTYDGKGYLQTLSDPQEVGISIVGRVLGLSGGAIGISEEIELKSTGPASFLFGRTHDYSYYADPTNTVTTVVGATFGGLIQSGPSFATNEIGVRFVAPINGTNRSAIWADNAYIGSSFVTPPLNGLRVEGAIRNDTLSASSLVSSDANKNLTSFASGTSTQVLHGNLTWSAVSLTADVTGTLGQGNGGTGATSYGANRIIYQNSTNTAFTSSANLIFDGNGSLTLSTGSTAITEGVFKSLNSGGGAEARVVIDRGHATSGYSQLTYRAAGSTVWEVGMRDSTTSYTMRASGSNHFTMTTAGALTLTGSVTINNLTATRLVQTDSSKTLSSIASGTSTQLLHGDLTWSAVSLTADVSGTLGQANGGTGAGSVYGSNRIIIQNSGNTAFTSSANFTYDGSTLVALGVGTTTNVAASIARFGSIGTGTLGQIYGISIDKTGAQSLLIGLNKNSATNSVPASYAFISTYNTTSGIVLGRGGNNGLPNTADITIDTSGNIIISSVAINSLVATNGSNTLVAASGTYGISISGNAATATALQTARNIGGVSFNGTTDIVPQLIQTVDETVDTTCFVLLANTSGTQTIGQQPKTNTGLTYNSATNSLANTGDLSIGDQIYIGSASPSAFNSQLKVAINDKSEFGIEIGGRVLGSGGEAVGVQEIVTLRGSSTGDSLYGRSILNSIDTIAASIGSYTGTLYGSVSNLSAITPAIATNLSVRKPNIGTIDVAIVADNMVIGTSIYPSIPTNNLYVEGSITNAALTATRLVQTDSSKNLSSVASGTSTQLLHGDLTWSAVSLTADVSGILPLNNGGTNSQASNFYSNAGAQDGIVYYNNTRLVSTAALTYDPTQGIVDITSSSANPGISVKTTVTASSHLAFLAVGRGSTANGSSQLRFLTGSSIEWYFATFNGSQDMVISRNSGATNILTMSYSDNSITANTGDIILGTNGKVVRFVYNDADKILLLGRSNSAKITHSTNWIVGNYAGSLISDGGGVDTGQFSWFAVNSAGTAFRQLMNLGNAGDLKANLGSIIIDTAGKGLNIKEGTNARQGVATLVAGSVVVSTTAVTANSRIMATPQNTSGTSGDIGISTRTAGTSFTITSGNPLDTRLVAWVIFEPA